MTRARGRGFALAVVAALGAAALGGCGGQRQDANEPSGHFRVRVTAASFPAHQAISQRSTLRLEVRNADRRTLPDVAVTVQTAPSSGGAAPEAFGQADTSDARLADDATPVWILDRGPTAGETAYVDTWAVGHMFPGETKSLEWSLVPVKPGHYTVTWRVAPGLNGKARAAGGERTRGSFDVTITGEPVPARVNDSGKVVRGQAAGSGGD
jgi:hypothetical protein